MWDVLTAIGIARKFRHAISLFYVDNLHWLRLRGELSESVNVQSGIRQGCPLSPLIFALCADVLLRELSRVISAYEGLRAFADDTVVVIQDYTRSLHISPTFLR